jgi:8-oxo-dGTP pyrophosphatase MutT (NUDIX family)
MQAKPLKIRNSAVNHDHARREHSAGGLVFKRLGRRTAIGFIKDSYGKWTFPKGHLEKGETSMQAALRETREEMGLRRLHVVSFLGSIAIRFKDRYRHVGQTVQKRIDFYLMETAPDERGRPEKSEGIKAICWVPPQRAIRFAGYKNVQPIIRKAVSLLETGDRN